MAALAAPTTIDAELRAGLPPRNAPGLEPVADAIERFRHGELDAAELVAAVDLAGFDMEAEILGKIAWFEALASEGPLSERGQRALAGYRASRAWMRRFPCWSPVWRT